MEQTADISHESLTADVVARAAGIDTSGCAGEEDMLVLLDDVKRIRLRVDSRRQGVESLGYYLRHLSELRLDHSTIESLRDLGTRFKWLRVLWIPRCGVESLDGLSGLERLEELYASFNEIEDVSAVAGNDVLRVLDLEANRVSSLSSLRLLGTMRNLEELVLRTNPVCGLPLYRRVVVSRIRQLKMLDEEDVTEEDGEGIDAAVWRGIEAAGRRIERGEGDEVDEAEHLARVLDDDDDGGREEEEEEMVVAMAIRSGAELLELEGGEEGNRVRENAILGLLDDFEMSPGSKKSGSGKRQKLARPMSATRARSAGAAARLQHERRETAMRPLSTTEASRKKAEMMSMWSEAATSVDSTGRPQTATSQTSRGSGSFLGEEPRHSSRSRRADSGASELTRGIVLAGNPAIAMRRARKANAQTSSSNDVSVLETLDAMRRTEEKERLLARDRRQQKLNPTTTKPPPSFDHLPSTANEVDDPTLIQLFTHKPKTIPQLHSREAFRAFFKHMPEERFLRLIRTALGPADPRVQKRYNLVQDLLTKG